MRAEEIKRSAGDPGIVLARRLSNAEYGNTIRDLTGHGVGRRIHEEPAVPNFYSPFTRGRLRDGQVLAVEPLVSSRPARIVEDPDGWTLRTHNYALAVHHEHTVVVTKGEALVLTGLGTRP